MGSTRRPAARYQLVGVADADRGLGISSWTNDFFKLFDSNNLVLTYLLIY
jgi:hypothetical protein